MPEQVHLGAVVYVWGAAAQDRLLNRCLGPAAEELRRRGVASRFWFDRYDARGPHVFAVLTVRPERQEEISKALAGELRRFLDEQPSSEDLSPNRLAQLQSQTRGRLQCKLDGRPGIAANNSFEVFEHPWRGYPFHLSDGLPGEEELWELVSGLSLWTISRLGPHARTATRLWTASVDREVRLADANTADYWRHHATTLLTPLSDGMSLEEQAAALDHLAKGVGALDPSFAEAWEETSTTGPVWPGLPRLVGLSLGDSERPARWSLFREIDHVTLKQLGLPVALHVPLVLYAWRNGRAG
ncbi:MAG TPA: lantibiotic dehydratase C-terminal domain-containing protein [Thermoanaerobaculia bacterium]|nr:lantibiotic dehydratase C-terminal domain-containing protein [Thermoanaerobaculia bacterium]